MIAHGRVQPRQVALVIHPRSQEVHDDQRMYVLTGRAGLTERERKRRITHD